MPKKELPIVDVVLICYNQERYIAEAIESVVSQKADFPFYLYIGDDGSKDNTPNIVREYAEKYPDIIIPVIRPKNIGAVPNYLDLVRRCKHKYIAFLEGDDAWCNPRKLQMQVKFLEKHPEYVATSAWCNYVDSNGTPSLEYNDPYLFLYKKHRYSLKDYKKGLIPGSANTIVTRNIFKTCSFDWKSLYTDPLIGDQINFFLMVQGGGKIYCLHKPLLNYRYCPNTTSDSFTAKRVLAQHTHDYHMYRYYLNLERAYYKTSGCFISLGFRISHCLYSIIRRYLRQPTKDDFNTLVKMIKENPHKFRTLFDLLFYILQVRISKIYNISKIRYLNIFHN